MQEYIELTVLNGDGTIIKADVNKKNSIKYIQTKIQSECGISLKNPCFTCDDAILLNDSLKNKNVCSNSTVSQKDVKNMVSAIDKIQLKSESNDSGYDMINDIEEGSDNNDNVEEVLYFTIKTDAGKSFMMKIDENNFIETLMSEIQETCGIPFEQQCFTCFDESTLSDQFWENEYEKLFNDIKKCREDTADMITALENFDLNNGDITIDEASYHCESEKSNNNVSSSFEDKYITVECMHTVSDSICFADGNTIDLKEPKLKILMTDELFATKNSVSSPNAVSSLIQKIVKCNLQTMDIYKQCLSSREYNFLTDSATLKFIKIRECTIKYDNGSTVPIDKLFSHLKLLVKFEMHYSDLSSMFEVDTVKKIVEILSRSGKLRCFGLHGLTDIFDVSMFARFFKINTNVDVRLEYKKKLSADYKEKLHEILQELVENPPKMIPYIRFPGYDKVKHAGYEKLYQRQ